MLRHRETEAVDKTFQHGPAHFISSPPHWHSTSSAIQYITSQFFWRRYRFRILDKIKTGTKNVSETLVPIYPLTRRRIPGGIKFPQHHYENLKLYVLVMFRVRVINDQITVVVVWLSVCP